MIPVYLQGKSVETIMANMRSSFIFKSRHTSETFSVEGYCDYLEMLLIIAIKDALCNADYENEPMGSDGAAGRAIAFLNMVLPYEEKK